MSEDKLSSEQVPPKFAEWLLAMGCPPEDVPPPDKITEMCRGQYYMVWRSLMEHVGPKDIVLNKQLQVFNDDVSKCMKKNVFNEDANIPEELSLWRKQAQMRDLVSDAELRLAEENEQLKHITDKVSSKLAHRNLSRRRLQEAQRRSWLLQQLAAELREKKENLLETRSITDSMCGVDESQDIENKVEKCLSALSRPVQPAVSRAGVSLLSVASPVASSSIVSTSSENDAEEQVSTLVKCRGDVVFKQLYERRARLCNMAAARDAEITNKDRCTPQSVLAETAALHCNLALEAMKNRVHIKQTGKRLAAAINELNNYLSGEACELLVLKCERAHSTARSHSLLALCSEVRAREGVFASAAGERDGRSAAIVHTVDKAITSKHEELKRLIVSTAAVERKTHGVRSSLAATFASLHEKRPDNSPISIASPQDSISSVRQFYEERREKRRKKVDLSMDLDVSEGCSYELTDNGSPKFIDELRFYLKKFSLENNRKFILESGEKIWIFETVQSLLHSLRAKWQSEDITTSVICPSVSLAYNLERLAGEVDRRRQLEAAVRALDGERKHELDLDIQPIITEEKITLDRIKKRLNENILNLHKTEKTLNIGMDNLKLWSDNGMRLFISEKRMIDGVNYKQYEVELQESLFMDCDKKRRGVPWKEVF